MADSWIENMVYKPSQFQQINPIDVEQVYKTSLMLAEAQNKSIETQDAFRKAIYQLPLNEKDEVFRQQIIDNFDEQMETLGADGDFTNDYRRILDYTTSILNSKEMRGRINANAEYKAWVDKVKKLGDEGKMPRSYVEYYLEMNPYEYKDTDDGSLPTWKPKIDFTPVPDTSKVVDLALKQLSPNKSSGYIDTYLTDADGKRLEDWRQGGFVMDGNGYKVWLPPEKISSAIREVIRTNQVVNDGYWAMYNINKWYDEKHKDKNEYDYSRQIPLNKEGYQMGYNEWLFDMFKPMVDNLSYYEGYPPTAAMRNAALGISNPRSRGSKKTVDPAKAAEKEERQEIKNATNRLIGSGMKPAEAKKAATAAVQQSKVTGTGKSGSSGKASSGTPTKQYKPNVNNSKFKKK